MALVARAVWTIRRDGERRLTAEADNRSRQVVQAKGLDDRNRLPYERRVLDAWAMKNNCKVRLQRWGVAFDPRAGR